MKKYFSPEHVPVGSVPCYSRHLKAHGRIEGQGCTTNWCGGWDRPRTGTPSANMGTGPGSAGGQALSTSLLLWHLPVVPTWEHNLGVEGEEGCPRSQLYILCLPSAPRCLLSSPLLPVLSSSLPTLSSHPAVLSTLPACPKYPSCFHSLTFSASLLKGSSKGILP